MATISSWMAIFSSIASAPSRPSFSFSSSMSECHFWTSM